MKPNWQNIMNAGPCPEPQKLERYYYEQLPNNERFAIENHLADCEMCSDYVEGLSLINKPEKVDKAEAEIKQKIHELLDKKEKKLIFRPIYKRLAIAASILIIVSISFVTYYQLNKPAQQIAEQLKEHTKADSTVAQKDTLVIAKAETKVKKPEFRKQAYSPTSDAKDLSIPAPSVEAAKSMNNSNYEESQAPNVEKEQFDAEEKIELKKENALEKPQLSERSISNNQTYIKGVVKDEAGNPLPGANIVLKGTPRGTVTDIEGKFSIPVNPSDTQISVAYVGYQSEEISLKDKKDLELTMKEDIVALNEVVVVGYGVQKKTNVTGSISSVPSSDVSNIQEALSGKASGVEVNNSVKKNKKSNAVVVSQWSNTKNLVVEHLKAENYQKSKEALLQLKNFSIKKSNIDAINEALQLLDKSEFKKALKKVKNLEE